MSSFRNLRRNINVYICSRCIILREYVHKQLRQGAIWSNYYIFKSLPSCMFLTHWRINPRTKNITTQSEDLWFEPLEKAPTAMEYPISSGKSCWFKNIKREWKYHMGYTKKILTGEVYNKNTLVEHMSTFCK